MKKTYHISTYKEVFIEATTKKECIAIMKQYEQKGWKADKPIRKGDWDSSGLIYYVFMSKETGGYINAPPTDITANPHTFN